MRSFGSLLILILIGITIFVVSGRNDSVMVSHAKLTDDARSSKPVVRPRNLISREPVRYNIDDSFVPIVEIAAKPPEVSDNLLPPNKSKEPSINNIKEIKDDPQEKIEYSRIVIPSLKINGKILSIPYTELSWDLTTLGQDIAFLEEVPGQTTDNNVVFAGHITVRNGSNGPFRYLWKINPGEKIILVDDQFVYTYIVREQKLVFPEESSVLADTSHSQMTLITCHTWDEETLSYLRRLVVFADLEKTEARHVIVH
jgi:LPXTG-site transpeptidase (sortase) family protein